MNERMKTKRERKKETNSYRTSIFGSEALIARVHESNKILIVMSFPLPQALKCGTIITESALSEA